MAINNDGESKYIHEYPGGFGLSNKAMKWAYGKPSFVWMIILELFVINVIAIAFLLDSQESGYSALLGGLIAIISNFVFDFSAYRYSGASEVHKMVRRVYQGEILKISMAALLFAAVFNWVTSVKLVALFAVFFFMIVIHGFVAAFCVQRFNK